MEVAIFSALFKEMDKRGEFSRLLHKRNALTFCASGGEAEAAHNILTKFSDISKTMVIFVEDRILDEAKFGSAISEMLKGRSFPIYLLSDRVGIPSDQYPGLGFAGTIPFSASQAKEGMESMADIVAQLMKRKTARG